MYFSDRSMFCQLKCQTNKQKVNFHVFCQLPSFLHLHSFTGLIMTMKSEDFYHISSLPPILDSYKSAQCPEKVCVTNSMHCD